MAGLGSYPGAHTPGLWIRHDSHRISSSFQSGRDQTSVLFLKFVEERTSLREQATAKSLGRKPQERVGKIPQARESGVTAAAL
jgi:hypothetical protein